MRADGVESAAATSMWPETTFRGDFGTCAPFVSETEGGDASSMDASEFDFFAFRCFLGLPAEAAPDNYTNKHHHFAPLLAELCAGFKA